MGVNRPGSQEDLVSNWEPASSQFGKGRHLWGQVCPFLYSSGYRPPASLPPAGDGPVCRQLTFLRFLLSPLFCERVQQCLRLEFSVGKFSLFFLCLFSPPLWLSHGLGFYLTLAPLDCPQGIQAQSLP